MPEWIPISSVEHRSSFFQPPTSMTHTAVARMVPILRSELKRAVSQFVLAFAQHDGQLRLVALLGGNKDNHLYLHPDGSWLGSYVPAMFRTYPFQYKWLQNDEPGLVIFSDALTRDTEHGKPLFDAGGGLSGEVKSYAKFLGMCAADMRVTDKAVALLNKHDLLKPWTDESGAHSWSGELLEIDQEKFEALDVTTIAAMQGAPLAIAYAQIYARGQMETLARRLEALKSVKPKEDMLPSFLGADNDEMLRFDFEN